MHAAQMSHNEVYATFDPGLMKKTNGERKQSGSATFDDELTKYRNVK